MSHEIHNRLLLLLAVGIWFGLATVAFASAGVIERRAIDVTLTPTATVTPTVTPTTFPTELALITITVKPSTASVRVGEQLTVAVHIDNEPRECTFSMYDLTLRQPLSDTVWFTFLSPDRLGPPVPTDATFTLQAVKPGAVSLSAALYGEEYCGFWQWSYRYGQSPIIQIAPPVTATTDYYLPWIQR